MEEKHFIKPSFDIEVKAEIKGIAKIEDNINDIKQMAIQLKEYYENVVFTEDDMKSAKDEKANINKFKDKVAEFKSKILAEYNKPIEIFDTTAREAIKTLDEAYKLINVQVAEYETRLKAEKETEILDYFTEYASSHDIDFVNYKQANINVTLTASMKGLKESAKGFINKICDDLILIDTQEHKAEILAEYKQSLNVAGAITSVTDRFKRIEAEKVRMAELQAKKEAEAQVVAKVEEKVIAPVIETVEPIVTNAVKLQKATFTVIATKEKMDELKSFLIKGGYRYE